MRDYCEDLPSSTLPFVSSGLAACLLPNKIVSCVHYDDPGGLAGGINAPLKVQLVV